MKVSNFMAFVALGLTFGLVSNAIAQNMGGGFQGPGVATSTVADALKMSDDTPVVLKGKIEKSLGNEKYQFNDGTATIVVEIDDDEWNGLNVTPENIVQITGEIDKEMLTAPEVDVEMIVLAQ